MITSIYDSRLERWSLQVLAPAEYFEAACQFTPCDVPDNLNKLAAVVTRARIVSELSLVVLA